MRAKFGPNDMTNDVLVGEIEVWFDELIDISTEDMVRMSGVNEKSATKIDGEEEMLLATLVPGNLVSVSAFHRYPFRQGKNYLRWGSKYTGAMLRKLRAERGVGRPPRRAKDD